MFLASLSASIILGLAMFGFVVLTVTVVGVSIIIHERRVNAMLADAEEALHTGSDI